MPNVAFYTFGILREPRGHALVEPFVTQSPITLEEATRASGYLDAMEAYEEGHAFPRFADGFESDVVEYTLSVWRDLISVWNFSYRGMHADNLRRRAEWFVKGDWPTYVAWWVPSDWTLSVAEACGRLEYLHDHGPTPIAFDFRTPFDATGLPVSPAKLIPLDQK